MKKARYSYEITNGTVCRHIKQMHNDFLKCSFLYVFIVTKRKVQSNNTNRQMVSTITEGKKPEHFLKNKMFCTVLKGCEVASEMIKILLLGLLLVQRAASLMSNDLDTDSTS